jgi:ketosteroid isomerase-like protein
MRRLAAALLLCAATLFASTRSLAQTGAAQSIPPPATSSPAANPAVAPPTVAAPANPAAKPNFTFTPMQTPNLPPGVLELLSLEGQFSAAVTAGGGRAFSSWFADDGITLNNGQPAVRGRLSIAAAANWDPALYKLSWYAEGAQMGPSNDTGFTWGHYDATTLDKDGKSITTSGRYITFWKKVNGKWRVALDASANEPPPTNGLPTP